MKSKATTYLLVFAVLAVWGLIVFRIVTQLKKSPELPEYVPELQILSVEDSISANYKLKYNYSDPFLKNTLKPVVSTATAEPEIQRRPNMRQRITSRRQIEPPEPQIVWPNVLYGGIIINDKNGEELALIDIDGISYLLKPGDVRNNVSFVSMYADSVIVKFETEQKTIHLKE